MDVSPELHIDHSLCTDRRTGYQRPAPCGISIGHPQVKAGTIGAIVRKAGADNGKRYILSNNHILAVCNKSSGVTEGKVRYQADIKPFHIDNLGTVIFKDVWIIYNGANEKDFSEDGDSGALILDKDNRACALLFAGGARRGNFTCAVSIQTVLEKLEIELVCVSSR